MNKAAIAVRILLGVAFLVFGLNGFFHFFAPPPPAGADALAVATVLNGVGGYIMKSASFFEVLAAVLLLSGRLVPLALLFLAPILVNILTFHVALDMGGIGGGVVFSAMTIFLAWVYRSSFAGVLNVNAKPG